MIASILMGAAVFVALVTGIGAVANGNAQVALIAGMTGGWLAGLLASSRTGGQK